MKKSILIAALVLTAGLFLARPGHAQLQAGGVVNTIPEGMFNVLATQAGVGSNVWDITVSWKSNEGVTPAFIDDLRIGFATGGQVTPNGQNDTGQFVKITGLSGSVLKPPYSLTDNIAWDLESALPTNIGELEDPNVALGFPDNPSAPVEQGQSLTGTVTLASSAPIGGVYFDLSNSVSGHMWFATPEGSTLALLLPGLIPLGLILRRRRQA